MATFNYFTDDITGQYEITLPILIMHIDCSIKLNNSKKIT